MIWVRKLTFFLNEKKFHINFQFFGWLIFGPLTQIHYSPYFLGSGSRKPKCCRSIKSGC